MKNIPIYCLLFFVFVFGCKQGDEAKVSNFIMPSEETGVAAEVSSPLPPPMQVNDASYGKENDAPQKSGEPTIEAKIIKEGNIRFETNDLQATYKKIIDAVKKQKATIQNDVEGKDELSLFRNMVIRVPSQNFDVFVNDISNGVTYFDRKEISSKDVTEEFIDVEARLKAKKVLEARYFELLQKANKVSEMIEIETQLATIREEIDAKEGQLRYMKSRISMSTISLEFYKTQAEESGATVSFFSKFWNAIVSGFNGISSFFIGIVQLWPFILIFVSGFYIFRKRIRNKNKT